MTLSIDDLVRLFEMAFYGAANGPRDKSRSRNAVAVIVTALRDEIVDKTTHYAWTGNDIFNAFEEILAPRGDEAAGGSTREDERSAEAGGFLAAKGAVDTPAAGFFVERTPELDAMFDAPAAAPDVCVWLHDPRGRQTSTCLPNGITGWMWNSRFQDKCPNCWNKIKFVEAAR